MTIISINSHKITAPTHPIVQHAQPHSYLLAWKRANKQLVSGCPGEAMLSSYNTACGVVLLLLETRLFPFRRFFVSPITEAYPHNSKLDFWKCSLHDRMMMRRPSSTTESRSIQYPKRMKLALFGGSMDKSI